MISRWFLACAAVLAATATHVSRAQPSGYALFTDPPVRPLAARSGDGRDRLPWRVVRVATERLGHDRLVLNLFPGTELQVRRRADEVAVPGAWTGQVDGDPLSSVTFVQSGAIVQGSVRTGEAAFSLEPIGAGPDHVLRQVDVQALPVELPPLQAPRARRPWARSAVARDEGDTIDLLAVYTTGARLDAGGSDEAVRARIALGVAETNLAYARSGVLPRLRLVGTELVGYRETHDLAQDLQALTGESDGALDLVHARRNETGADLVTLIVSTASGACGVAWVMQSLSTSFAPFAFSVTAYHCISPNYTFGHELAHNMGSAHAPEDPNALPIAPYAYGYKDPGARFRTIMAYDCPSGCPRVLQFSNPLVDYDGRPTGTAAQHHNARSLNEVRTVVANFRPSRDPADRLAAPGNFTVRGSGTSLTLEWSPPAGVTPAGYDVEVGSIEGLDNLATLRVDGGSTALLVRDVPPGDYFLRVRARNANGPGAPSTSERVVMTPFGRCLAPVAAPVLDAPVVNGSRVALSWATPATGGAAHHYLIGAGRRPQSVDAAVIRTPAAAPTFESGAELGVYFVRVAGVNECGVGEASNEVVAVVGPPVPGPPSDLVAVLRPAERLVTLSWQAPTAGGDATGYIVEAGTGPGLTNVARLFTGSPDPSFRVAAPAGRYYVRVRAVNGHGQSAPSDEILVTVF